MRALNAWLAHAFNPRRAFDAVARDARFALRALLKAPAFTLTVVAALALGIGANTAIFTVVNTVLLNRLPYPDSDRLVTIVRQGGGQIAEPLYGYWEQNNPGFEDLAAFHSGAAINLEGGDKPELVRGVSVSRNYFRLFGALPILGRTFTPSEDAPGGARALVMSYGLWQSRFGSDRAILGKTVLLGGAPYTVVGVLSRTFKAYPPADLWMPLHADANSTNQAGVLTICARLPRGLALSEADARMTVLDRRYAATRGRGFLNAPAVEVTRLDRQMTGDIRPALLILLGAVGLVLLIACANVANLLLARAAARRRNIAIRAAVGARRGRIVRQLLTESLLLALAGGICGLALGSWGVRALISLAPGDLPRIQEMAAVPALDPRIAAFTFALAAGAGILFGLFPALQLSRADLLLALNESGGRSGYGLTHNRARAWLAAAEVAIAVVLLCGAVLLIRSFAAMHGESPGFDSNNVLTAEISLSGKRYSNSAAVDHMAGRILDRLQRAPGVESAALASALPLYGKMDMIFKIPGRTPPAGSPFSGDVQWRFVSARYFDVLRIPLIAGRLLRDREPGRTVVISESMSRRFWPRENPVGQTIFIGPLLGKAYQVGDAEIVGIVGDVRERLWFEPSPVMYQPPSQIPDADMALLNAYESAAVLIRTRPGVAPATLARPVERILLNAGLPAANVRTMDRAALASTGRQNFNLLLLAIFAALALLLAAVGIYGVMSYSVQQRTQEIGIRAALGATRRDALSLVLFEAFRASVVGAVIGVAAAFGLTRLLRSQLFGVGPSDPLTFALVPLILVAIALAGAFAPALRATRVDPIVALRHE